MYFLTKTFHFDAAHFLPDHGGACKNLHGHTWRVDVKLQSLGLSESGEDNGMVMDFHEIKDFVKPVIDRLDHSLLNDILENPTAENLAKWIYGQLLLMPHLLSVTVWESPTACCEYMT